MSDDTILSIVFWIGLFVLIGFIQWLKRPK